MFSSINGKYVSRSPSQVLCLLPFSDYLEEQILAMRAARRYICMETDAIALAHVNVFQENIDTGGNILKQSTPTHGDSACIRVNVAWVRAHYGPGNWFDRQPFGNAAARVAGWNLCAYVTPVTCEARSGMRIVEAVA